MSKELEQLLDAAKNLPFSEEEKEEQRRSFAYGNTKIENPRITREMVDQEAEALKEK
jgi:Fic family protein